MSRTGTSQDFDGGHGAWQSVFGARSQLTDAFMFHQSHQIHCY